MTIAIGVLCTDGVVIGADSSATFGPHITQPTIEQKTQKVHVLHNRFVVTSTGAIGANQRFLDGLDKAWVGNKFNGAHTAIEYGRRLCATGKDDFAATKMDHMQYGALVAFPVKRELHLVELALFDFQPELKTPKMWFCCMGSGQKIADPFFGMMRRVFYPKSQPTLKEGLFMTTWALMHAIELNTGGIDGPPQLATLSLNEKGESTAQILTEDDVEEHKGSAVAAERHLSCYREILNNPAPAAAGGEIPGPAAT